MADAELVCDEMPEPKEPRETQKLKWQWANEVVPNFWEPGLIDGILELVGMTVMYGPSSGGKTAIAVDMACCIAAGKPWRGRETQKGLVIYFAVENAESTKRRFWAWIKENQWKGDLPVVVVSSPLVVTEKSVRKIIAMIEEIREAADLPVRMVIFDTLARTLDGDENDAGPVGRYVRCLDRVRDAFQTMVQVIHHTGKDESRGARGSSALRAATDHELAVDKKRGNSVGKLIMAKVRDGDLEGKEYGFKLTPSVMGRNKLGREVTTVIVEEHELPVSRAKAGGAEAKVREAFIELKGQKLLFEEFKEYVGNISSGKPTSEKKAWQRLFGDNVISMDGDGFVTWEARSPSG